MDPASFVASVLALAETTFAVVEFLHEVKEGGKQRFKLLAEVTSLWNVLDNLHKTLESIDSTTSEAWTRALLTLNEPDGALKESERLVSNLLEKFKPSTRQSKIMTALKWPFEKQEAQNTIDQAHRLQTAISVALGQANLLLSMQIHEDTSATRKLLGEQEVRKIVEWLSPLNFNSQQSAVYKEYCAGTGTWLLESDHFKRWSTAEESLLWCAGMPGAGKTLLASLIVHELRIDSSSSKSLVLVGYCRFDDPACQNVQNILGALVKQTIHSASDISDDLANTYTDHQRNGTQPDLQEMISILSRQIAQYRRVFVVIDALDELNAGKDREALLKSLRELPKPINLLFLSRELLEIQNQLRPIDHCCDGCDLVFQDVLYHCDLCAFPQGHLPGGFDACQRCHDGGLRCPNKEHPTSQRLINGSFMRIEAHEGDLRRYLETRISSDSGLSGLARKKKGLQEEIITEILKSSQSMFLLAKLAIDNLATCLTVRDIKKCLKEIPEGLQAAYDQTMQRIDQQDRHRSTLAREVLKWALMSLRPLTWAEMEQAISIEPEMDELDLDDIVPASTLVSLCAGLLLIDHNGFIRWIHYTAEEYFAAKAESFYPGAGLSLTESCLTFLCLDTFTTGPCKDQYALKERQQMYPFYEYAVSQWSIHIAKSDQTSNHALALSFLESDPLRKAAIQCLWDSAKDWIILDMSSSVPALHFAVYLGLDFAVRHFLDQGADGIDSEDGTGWTPLTLAAQGNHSSLARMLLDHGAQINRIASSGAAAIHIAAFNGYSEFVDLLLSRPDIDVNLVRPGIEESPLMFAARGGHVEIVKMLLERPGIDVELQNYKDSSTALEIAMQNKRNGVASLLLNVSSSFANSEKKPGKSTLFKAIQHDQVDLIEILVSKGADLEQCDERGLTPLLISAQRGRSPALFRRLLELGANPKAVAGSGKSLLHIAATNADALRICFELKLDLDINARTKKSGRTPLHQAVLWGSGNSESIQMLVKNGADVTLRDFTNKSTAWDYSDRLEDRSIADLLKFTGPGEDVRDGVEGKTPGLDDPDLEGSMSLVRHGSSFETIPESPPPPYEETVFPLR